jgi:tetratricopeptide (TPR) repeat protein
MKIAILTTLFLLLCCSTSFGQTENRYQEVDALIKTNSMFDAMTALNKLRENHKKDTLDAEYWLRYSKATYTLYKYEDAWAAIDKSIKLNPENAVLYFEKGLLLNKIGNTDSSLKSLERAVQIKPIGEYFYWKGIVNQQLNNLTEADADYKSAIKNGFETPELHNNYAILLLGNEHFQEGLVHINKAIALDNKYAQAYSARSKLHLYLLNIDSACIDKITAYNLGYRRFFEIPDSVCNGSDPTKWKFVGDLCASSMLYAQGIKAYTKLIDNNYNCSDYFLNRGYCYYNLKDYLKAEKDYLRALGLPNAAKDLLYDNLSLLCYHQNNFMKSIEFSTKRIELNPKNHVPYIDRGLCYRKLKKYKEAERDFNKSLEIKPDFFRAFGYRSFLFLELGQYQKSFEDASKSIEINPKYGYGYIVLAQAKQKLGLSDFCIDFYNAKKYGEPDADNGIKEYCK